MHFYTLYVYSISSLVGTLASESVDLKEGQRNYSGNRGRNLNILSTLSSAISYVSHRVELIFVQYRTISIAMMRT